MNKKIILAIGVSLSISINNGIAQSKKVQAAIQDVFSLLGARTKYIYIADTTLTSFPFSYNNLKYSVAAKDTDLLRVILEKGQKQAISGKDVESILKTKNRRKTISEFSSIRTQLFKLTKNERKILRAIDSLENLRSKLAFKEIISFKDSINLLQLHNKELALFKNKDYISYVRKMQQEDKRLLFFFPLFKYMRTTLLVISCYKAITDSFMEVRITTE